MRWAGNIFREVFRLFVDDGKFALAILIWLGAARLVLPGLPFMRNTNGIVLFVGLGMILFESTIRSSRSKRLPAGK